MRPMLKLSILLVGVIVFAGWTIARPQEEPKVKTRVYSYPTILKLAGVEGDVELRVFVNEQGKVDSAQVLKATNPDFISSALEAIKQWEFFPAKKDGKPIRSEIVIPFHFRMHDNAYRAKNEDLMNLVKDVEAILRGEVADSLKEYIDPEAYAVIGTSYEPLYPLVFDKSKRVAPAGGKNRYSVMSGATHLNSSKDVRETNVMLTWGDRPLIEGKNTKFEFTRTVVDETDDSAYLVIKTRATKKLPERYHTIVLMKTSGGRWRIRAWQVSP